MPYKPKRWLKVPPAGVKEGDLVFVAGYPGRTKRLATYAEVKEAVEWTLPAHDPHLPRSSSPSSRRSASRTRR